MEQKLYGDVYLDSHKSYSSLGTDSNGKIIETLGIDTTFPDADGNIITVTGGIITDKTSP